MNINTMPLEAETRVLIDRSLENLGWKLDGKDQNVYYEQPKTEAEREKDQIMSFTLKKVINRLL